MQGQRRTRPSGGGDRKPLRLASLPNHPSNLCWVVGGVLLLQACSTRGGLSLSASENSAAQNQSDALSSGKSESLRVIEGKAINGYLENAIIFIDLNGDGKLSSGEPITLSKQGAFSLEASSVGPVVAVAVDQLSAAERAYALPALSAKGIEIPDGLTTTYQHNGEVSRFSGRMESQLADSNESTNITPLSTLQSALVRSGLQLEAATHQIQ